MYPFQEFERCSTDILISRLGINDTLITRASDSRVSRIFFKCSSIRESRLARRKGQCTHKGETGKGKNWHIEILGSSMQEEAAASS